MSLYPGKRYGPNWAKNRRKQEKRDARLAELNAQQETQQETQPDPQAALLDATEQLLIGIGMGWDLDGLVEQAKVACIAAGSTIFDAVDALAAAVSDRKQNG